MFYCLLFHLQLFYFLLFQLRSFTVTSSSDGLLYSGFSFFCRISNSLEPLTMTPSTFFVPFFCFLLLLRIEEWYGGSFFSLSFTFSFSFLFLQKLLPRSIQIVIFFVFRNGRKLGNYSKGFLFFHFFPLTQKDQQSPVVTSLIDCFAVT
jgi:hypothetical protein